MVKRFFLITSFLFINILPFEDTIFFIYNSQNPNLNQLINMNDVKLKQHKAVN